MNHRVLATFVLLVALVGCKKSVAEATAQRQAWVDGATACPAKTTCTGKTKTLSAELATCAPTLEKSAYAPGDVIVANEMVGNTVGRIKAKHGEGWDVEFPDGYTLERAHEKIVARVCKP